MKSRPRRIATEGVEVTGGAGELGYSVVVGTAFCRHTQLCRDVSVRRAPVEARN